MVAERGSHEGVPWSVSPGGGFRGAGPMDGVHWRWSRGVGTLNGIPWRVSLGGGPAELGPCMWSHVGCPREGFSEGGASWKRPLEGVT